MKTNKKTFIVEVISGLFMLLFIYAAASKLEDFEKFRVQLGKSPVLNAFSGIVAYTIPPLEIALAVFLAIKRFQYLALYASFTLMVMFSAYIVAILNFSSYVPCSCGGILQNMSWTQHFWFNVLFIVLAAVGVLIFPNKDSKDLMAISGVSQKSGKE